MWFLRGTVPDHSQLFSNKSVAAGATVLKTVGDESMRVEKVGMHEVAHMPLLFHNVILMIECLEDSIQDI